MIPLAEYLLLILPVTTDGNIHFFCYDLSLRLSMLQFSEKFLDGHSKFLLSGKN